MQVPTDTNTYFRVSSKDVAKPSRNEHPPQYASKNPTDSTLYSFSPVGTSAMAVIPHSENPLPKYHVSVRINCFMPTSSITEIYLGGDESGQKVGAFEMGVIAAPSVVRLGNRINNTAIALTQAGTWGSWYWHPAGINEKYHLRWEYQKRPCICRSAIGTRPILAKFTPPAVHLSDELPLLEVTPEGQEYMDHILISLLLIERKRLTPGREETNKDIFN
ncbi:hypothetical protein GALMADRAFT_231797 [Galerina marginata CBS 339.88]|uniref:DUF6593 domain-containing protein n=1 Tax=Galerina marginata (strain CBS 339.88) TaxID=685588 RepID=A0A067SIR3_GALM3|nr:hypothetical protein GALMADRAFT_231797 [Galerina marginata CBS 339.88]